MRCDAGDGKTISVSSPLIFDFGISSSIKPPRAWVQDHCSIGRNVKMKGTTSMVLILFLKRSLATSPPSRSVSFLRTSPACRDLRRVVPTAFATQTGANDGNGMQTRGLSAARKSQYGERVCILTPPASTFESEVQDLSTSLSLPIHNEEELELLVDEESQGGASPVFTHCLCLEPYQIMGIDSYAVAIQSLSSSSDGNVSAKRKVKRNKKAGRQRNLAKPFYVDFCPSSKTKMGKRLAGGGQQGGELLLKATSLGRNKGSTVCDLTAGLASDSCIMAAGGAASVNMVERDPIVAVLLKDAFRRMDLIAKNDLLSNKGDEELIVRAKDLSNKLSFEENDAVSVAQRFAQSKDEDADRPDICYLDPMFPPRTKSALVKKNMVILHNLLETQSDEDTEQRLIKEAELLNAALCAARTKVVVKRPIQAPPLGGDLVERKPSNVIKGSVNRWDVYVL